MFTSTSIQGNLHEAVAWVNKSPILAPHVYQFVQQVPGVIGIVFRTPSREDFTAVRECLGQTKEL